MQGAARMLVRVAGSIGRFPCHTVPILTTAVLECSLAGLAATAYDCAATLMRPEHRDRINPAYRRKVEGIVRRREWCGVHPAPLACRFACPMLTPRSGQGIRMFSDGMQGRGCARGQHPLPGVRRSWPSQPPGVLCMRAHQRLLSRLRWVEQLLT